MAADEHFFEGAEDVLVVFGEEKVRETNLVRPSNVNVQPLDIFCRWGSFGSSSVESSHPNLYV